ncbi:hypothetical protein CTAYLR_000134 [Chrysophaeum taylorii]|uniref:mitogen-activated protein kinase kinase n=1 Tax=Chrysophaeum taylorii TaxID=2483200 RepID=A0AAD7XM55_9STRA|nr:hypothetical protein CTAYLR_000134 [Chrysophaeum taylorii]
MEAVEGSPIKGSLDEDVKSEVSEAPTIEDTAIVDADDDPIAWKNVVSPIDYERDEASSSPTRLELRRGRPLRVRELARQLRGQASRPESAPTEHHPPLVEAASRRRTQSQRERRNVGGIVMSSHQGGGGGSGYNLSESGVLRLGEFVIGPEGSLRQDLVPLDELGRGAGGCVQRALHVPSGVIVAVKKIAIDDERRRKQMVLELRALHGLKGTALAARVHHGLDTSGTTSHGSSPVGSRYVVDFFDTYVEPATNSLGLVLEFMNGGSLNDHRRRGTPVDERLLSRVAFCVLSALAYIHSRRELHRDVKPSNVLLGLRGEVKISDYGCHRHLDEESSLASTFTGTIAYMAPERIAGLGYSYPADIWSLGISLLATAVGRNPYAKHKVYWDVAHAIQNQPLPKLNPDGFSHDFRHFVDRCLQKDARQRPSATELLRHPFARAGRRVGLAPVLARLASPADRSRLATMLAALHDAKLTNPSVDPDYNPKLLAKMAAQLGVPLDTLETVYAEVKLDRRRDAHPRSVLPTSRPPQKPPSCVTITSPVISTSNLDQLALTIKPRAGPADRRSHRPADRRSNRPADRPADRRSHRSADRRSNRPADRPADRRSPRPADLLRSFDSLASSTTTLRATTSSEDSLASALQPRRES